VSSKHVADTCPRDHDAELPQLTDDPEIAPARVLARETKDECDDLSIERVGRDVLGRRVGPVSANELPVPPHQRCGPNEEGGPTLARKESREPRQHDTIGRGEPRSRHLTTEHRELVTKDRDLDVLLIWRRSDPNEVEQLSNEKEGHRTAHADDPGTFAASLVRAAFLRLHPTGQGSDFGLSTSWTWPLQESTTYGLPLGVLKTPRHFTGCGQCSGLPVPSPSCTSRKQRPRSDMKDSA